MVFNTGNYFITKQCQIKGNFYWTGYEDDISLIFC